MTKARDRNKLTGEDLIGAGLDELVAAERRAPPTEQDNIKQYNLMFKRIARIARRLERQILREERSGLPAKIMGRDVYALSTVYSQMREIIADVRTISDQSEQVAQIQNIALEPYSASMGQLFINIHYQLDRLVRDLVPENKVDQAQASVKALIQDMSIYVDKQHTEACAKVSSILLAPQEQLVTTTRRRSKTK